MKITKDFFNLSLEYKLFLLFWFLKPFYIFPSGMPQPSDFILILSFILFIIRTHGKINYFKIDLYFLYFIMCTILINCTYSFIYSRFTFLTNCLYYIFNFIVILLFSNFILQDEFINLFKIVIKTNILVQLLLLIGSRSLFLGERYVGTYNDPNQMAFSILCFYCSLIFLTKYLNEKLNLIWSFITLLLIYATVSTGMILAIFMILEIQLFFAYRNKNINIKFFHKILFIFQLFIVLTLGYNMLSSTSNTDNFLVTRLRGKLNKANDSQVSIIEDRIIDKALRSPINFIYGAGEGYLERFPSTSDNYGSMEIHSTWIALLFYYGIIPVLFVVIWIKNNLKNTTLPFLIFYVIILIESCTLANQRQPGFWILFMLCNLKQRKIFSNFFQLYNESRITISSKNQK